MAESNQYLLEGICLDIEKTDLLHDHNITYYTRTKKMLVEQVLLAMRLYTIQCTQSIYVCTLCIHMPRLQYLNKKKIPALCVGLIS